MKYLHGFLLLILVTHVQAQHLLPTDSLQPAFNRITIPATKHVSATAFVVPAALITTGALGISGEFIISNPEVKEERDEHFGGFHTSLDNYLQFAPVAAGYAMLIHNPQHSFWSYTSKVLLTQVMVNALVFPAKKIVRERRPDTGAPNSFPSGHTAEAFAGATIFSDEFAQHNIWLSASAYTGAAAVGALRVMNNRHWACDVVAGAGFGILSAKLSELIIQSFNKTSKQTFFKPQ